MVNRMKSKVYLLRSDLQRDDEKLSSAMGSALRKIKLFDFIKQNDFTAVKTHFGESKKSGYPRPVYMKAIAEIIKEKGGYPFLTETSTLYKGNRSDAVRHLAHSQTQGFTFEATGMPVIMADGLLGGEEEEVAVKGRLFSSVKIASLFTKIQSMVVVSHFTGHLAAGFGAAMKNLGMGCASRRGKMVQHSTAKPKIKENICTRCGVCEKWCPADAISVYENGAYKIDKSLCIGCGQCLAVCRFDAVTYNWGATYEDLQKKVVEHAMGAVEACGGRVTYINFLTRISKDCDCMNIYEEISPDVGILFSDDPVAIDAASLDLVELASGRSLSESAYKIPYRLQIDYGKELGFGNSSYEIIEL